MSATLEMEHRIAASLRRLSAMGVKYHLETVGKDAVYLVMDVDSIAKLIEKRITYPTREMLTHTDGEKTYLICYFWKGERQPNVFTGK